jgi:tripartite-type tricarboxylate transporter receptor subunit TctC
MFRGLLLCALAVTTTAAFAQTWPERPIRFIVSQSAGNATDIIPRVTAGHRSRAHLALGRGGAGLG